MGTLTKLWAGRIYGTNTGNLFLSLEEIGPTLRGTLRILDSQFGVASYAIVGSYGEEISLNGTPLQAHEGIALGTILVNAHLTAEGNLRGQWESSLGTAGTFEAFPHEQDSISQSLGDRQVVPEQIYTHNIKLGALTLYEADVRAILATIRNDFLSGRPIVTYSVGAGEVTKYADDFFSETTGLSTLSYLKLQIQEPEAYGINKIIVIELQAYGINEVRVQGTNESWVIGRAEVLATFLRKHQNFLATGYKKYGLNLNQVIFMALLVVIPEIESLANRAIFVVVVFALLAILLQLHMRFIPNARIHFGNTTQNVFSRLIPTILSWFFAIAASIVAAYLYTWMTSSSY